jgi:hypothetical protein
MKNLFLHNQILVNSILANQNYLWLVGRMGPAMMYSSNQNSLRNIAKHHCLSLIIYIELFESTQSFAVIIVSRAFMPICINSRILVVKVIFSV